MKVATRGPLLNQSAGRTSRLDRTRCSRRNLSSSNLGKEGEKAAQDHQGYQISIKIGNRYIWQRSVSTELPATRQVVALLACRLADQPVHRHRVRHPIHSVHHILIRVQRSVRLLGNCTWTYLPRLRRRQLVGPGICRQTERSRNPTQDRSRATASARGPATIHHHSARELDPAGWHVLIRLGRPGEAALDSAHDRHRDYRVWNDLHFHGLANIFGRRTSSTRS